MPETDSLKQVYADEIRDLWSANDQMARAVKMMAENAQDANLKHTLQASVTGITKHTETIMGLVKDLGAKSEKEHCKGMEGLVEEANKHIVKEPPANGDLRDLEIIAQYQRMSHYGLAGFGCAAAYARALGLEEHISKLKAIVSDIYRADEYATQLGEKAAKIAPKA